MTTTRPSHRPRTYTPERVVGAIETLLDRGEADRLKGGIHPTTLGAYLEIDTADARDYCSEYARAGYLSVVDGVNPTTLNPRKSYRPVGDGDE